MNEQGIASSLLVPVDPLRWPLIFTLLSMDVVIAFHDLLGLRVSAPTAFRELLRAEILQVRREFAAAPPGDAVYSPERTLEALALALGPAQRDHLLWWGQRIFGWDIQEHRSLLLWDDVLRFCALDAKRWRELRLPAHLADAARLEFVRATDRAPYDQRRVEVCDKPLSDWDLHMYVVNLFDDEDVASRGPESYLYATFTNFQGYYFWAWLTKQMIPQEQDELMRNAINLAKQEQSLLHVGALPPPSHLEIGL